MEITNSYTSRHAAYYLIRQLVLSYHHRELLPALLDQIQKMAKIELETLNSLAVFLCEYLDGAESDRQGILKDEDDPSWTWEDEMAAHPTNPDWEFAGETIFQELVKRNKREREDKQRREGG